MKRFLLALALGLNSLLLGEIGAARSLLPPVKSGKPLPADRFIELAKLVNPTVVNISTSQKPRLQSPRHQYSDPFFHFFEPFMAPQQSRPRQSLGTGFIIRKDGLIITNTHVIEGADVIKVQLSGNNKELFEAKLVGKDSRTDVALIKISTKKPLPVAHLGRSKGLEVGEWVAAFGNPFGHGHTMTKGIISAIGRELDEINRFPFLQTDASINPGNSGGPLVNMRGEVIGVNTAVDARAQGIGFAIPIDNVKSVLLTLEKDGRVKRGFLGVGLANFVDQQAANYLKLGTTEGALIQEVYKNTPASQAGIRPYDFITKIGKDKIRSSSDLIRSIADKKIGDFVTVELIRNGKIKKLNVRIAEHPSEKNNSFQNRQKKRYLGQQAPFNLGFKIANLNTSLRKDFNLPKTLKAPIIIDIASGSPAAKAGLNVGDIILDINKRRVFDSREVIITLKRGFNVLRVQRKDRSFLIYLRSR